MRLLSIGVFFLLLLFTPSAWMFKKEILELRMPSIIPTKADAYLCHPFVIPADETWYITSIGPILVDPETIHHIIVITCPVLVSNSSVWSCDDVRDPAFPKAPSCDTGNIEFMYDWTKDVDEYHFPKGVGFIAGNGGDYQNLILQVHYSDVSRFNESFRDTSGLKITFTRERTPMLAGLKTLGGNGKIRPGRIEHLEETCIVRLPDKKTLRIFSYLVHTHDLGLLVTAYRLRNGTVTEIGRRSPQLPKAFTPTDVALQDGDHLLVRCVMYNFQDTTIFTGSTHHDEMCIMRVLYYAEDGELQPVFDCTPVGWKPEERERYIHTVHH